MNRYAQLSNNIVGNVIESAAQPDASLGAWIACGNAGPGWTYDGTAFHAPVVVAPVDPCKWLIDLGPFYDRFGAAKMPVLLSTDATAKAIIADLNIRKWVDLSRADVAQGLAYIGSVVPSVTAALQTAIVQAPVAAAENVALRKLYFS